MYIMNKTYLSFLAYPTVQTKIRLLNLKSKFKMFGFTPMLSAIFTKGNNFNDMFAFVEDNRRSTKRACFPL